MAEVPERQLGDDEEVSQEQPLKSTEANSRLLR